MATDCTTTPFGVSEPLHSTSRTALARQLDRAFDALEAVIELEPRIAAMRWDQSAALLRRQEAEWEAAERSLRRVAGHAADGGIGDLRLGALAFVMHRALTEETPEQVGDLAAVVDDAIDLWLADSPQLHATRLIRARELMARFVVAFACAEPDLSTDELAPVL